MELVNKKYVKMHKFDIFRQMVNAGVTQADIQEAKEMVLRMKNRN